MLGHLVPAFADDLCRSSASFDLSAIIAAVGRDYLAWSGRVPVWLLSYSLFALGDTGRWLIDLASAAGLAITCWLAIDLARGERRPALAVDLAALVTIVTLLWFIPHRFGEFMLWKSGAIQYLWACVLALILVRATTIEMLEDGRAWPLSAHPAALVVLALVCGLWLETLALALVVHWFVLLALVERRGRRFERRWLIGFAALVVGSALLLAAPGNFVRAAPIGYLEPPLARLLMAVEFGWRHVHPALAATFVAFGALTLLNPDRVDVGRRWCRALSLLLVGAVSVLALAGAPVATWSGRTAFSLEFMAIVSTLCLFPAHLFSQDGLPTRWQRLVMPLRLAISAVIAGALTLVVASYIEVRAIYLDVAAQDAARTARVESARRINSGEPLVLAPLAFGTFANTSAGTVNRQWYFARDITVSPGHWRNRCYAEVHGVSGVVLNRGAGSY